MRAYESRVGAPKITSALTATAIIAGSWSIAAPVNVPEMRVRGDALGSVGGLRYNPHLRTRNIGLNSAPRPPRVPLPAVAEAASKLAVGTTAATLAAPTVVGLKEAIMGTVRGLDTPWSRRLHKLQADQCLGAVGLATVVDVLRRSDEHQWPIAGIFHSDEGGLRVEWRSGREQTLVEVEEDGTVYAAHFDFEAGFEADLENAGAAEAVTFLNEHLHA